MLFLLDKNVRTVKWNGIPLHEASSAIVKEEINGDFVLTVRYPITDSGIYQLIKEDMLIKAPTPVLGPQLFRIKKPIENDDSLDITAYHISDDVMKRSVKPVSVVGQSCAMALSQMVQNTKSGIGDFSFTSDIMDSRTFNTTEAETLYSVLLDGKHSIVGTWEGELVRDNFALSIKKNRGADRGVIITTHKNLKSYQRTRNSQNVVTRIHARSTFKPKGAEDEVTLRVTVDSPLINSYPYINERDYENNNARTIDDLRKWAEAKFKNDGIDKVSDAIKIEAYELDGQVAHLGDTVNLKSRKHNADVYKKAIAYEFNVLTEEYISLTFDDKPGVGGSGASSGLSNAADAILGASATAQEIAVQKAIDNANRAFDAEFDKRETAIRDGIEQAKADAEVYADNIRQEITGRLSEVDKQVAANKAQQATQYDEILAKANANTNLAQEAKNLGNQAKSEAANALSKALQYRNEAIAEAKRLDGVERQATESKIATAKSQAVTEADKLVETAKGLLSGQISNVSTDLSQTKEAIKLLATKATVDTLTGRVSSAEASLQVQAGEIASRVKSSDFDQAKQRLSSAESSITQLGNRITTEISETVAKIPQNVGSRNLILKSADFANIHKQGSTTTTTTTTDGDSFILKSQNYTSNAWGGLSWNMSVSEVKKGEEFSLYMPIYIDSSIPCDGGFRFEIKNHKLNKNAFWYDIPTNVVNQWVIIAIPVKMTADLTLGNWPFYVYLVKNGFVKIKPPMLVRGTLIPLQHLPAPEDSVSEIENVKTIIETTANGLTQVSSKVSQTEGKLATAETKITQLIGDVSAKVSKTDYDSLKQTVTNQGTAITQVNSAIALKAEKTYVDIVKSTADSAKTTASEALSKAQANAQSISQTVAELEVTNNAIKSKVSQTDFNGVTGRLSAAESTITQQAGEIAKRLTSVQVDKAITDKGYQTKSQVDSNITGRGYITESGVNGKLTNYVTATTLTNTVKDTTDSFSRSISRVEGLIPTDVSRANLILGTGDGESGSRKINTVTGVIHKYFPNNDNGLGEWSLKVPNRTDNLWAGWSWKLSENMIQGEKYSVLVDIWLEPDRANATLDSGAIEIKQHAHAGKAQIIVNTNNFSKTSVKHGMNRFAYTFTAQNSTDVLEQTEFYIYFRKSGFMNIRRPMMVKGEIIPNQWSPAIKDLTTVTALHEVKDTVDSHTRTISDQGNSISQVIQTAQGLVTRVNNLKSGSRNYLLNSKLTTTNMTGISGTGTLDVAINISADFWKHDDVNKNQKIRLSLYYQSSVAYSDPRTFPVYFRKSPWYRIGTITYPAGTTELMKFEFTFGTMPSGFDASQIFIRFDRSLDSGRIHTIERAHLEVSDLFSDWSPAPEDNDSAVQAVSSQINQLADSWAFKTLNGAGDILSQANLSSAQFLLEAAKIRLKGKTLADEIQAIDGKFNTLFVSDGTFGKLDATIIGAQAITGGQIKFDQAFFNNFMANEAYLKQLFAKNAFISQVQSVTMSASQISGGVLKALNNAMEMNMNSGQVLYYTDNAALKRILSGYPTQFVKFATGTVIGKGLAGVTIIGSNRYGGESTDDGGFVGIRAWNGPDIDQVDIVGDTIRLTSSPFKSADGWDVITLPNKLEIDAHNSNHRSSSRVKVGDVWLWKNASTYSSMRETINLIIDNLQLLHNNKTTESGYSYTMPAKV